MDEIEVVGALSALSHPTRLRVVRALGEVYPDGMPVGDLARLMDVHQTTMSNHLAILSRAKLTVAKRMGRVVQYSAGADALDELRSFVSALIPERAPHN